MENKHHIYSEALFTDSRTDGISADGVHAWSHPPIYNTGNTISHRLLDFYSFLTDFDSIKSSTTGSGVRSQPPKSDLRLARPNREPRAVVTYGR